MSGICKQNKVAIEKSFFEPWREQRLVVLCGLISAALLGCRSKIDVETKAGAPLAQPAVPEELPKLDPAKEKASDKMVTKEMEAAKDASKLFFSSRDSVAVELKREFLEGGRFMDIYNVTKSAPNEEGIVIVKDYEMPDNIDEPWPLGDGFTFDARGDVNLKFFQQSSEMRKKFFLGKNRLKIVVRDNASQRLSFVEVSLMTSQFFDFSSLVFANGKSIGESINKKGYLLEGWLNSTTANSVKDSSGKFTLIVGPFNQMHSF